MRLKHGLLGMLLAACAAFASLGSVHAEEVPVVTGEQWSKSTQHEKKIYLVGIANVIQVENAYAGKNPPSDDQSFLPRFTRGLKGQTLDTVIAGLDNWYVKNPGRLQRPVIETIWFEFVVPGLQKNK